MILKGRLGLIADMIPQCRCVGDIGTDHAYLPIYLVTKEICSSAVASDVRKGPVNTAVKNVEEYALSDRIAVRLGSGLEPLGENEADCIVIAGMGGPLITEILQHDPVKARNAHTLVLQPMSAIELIRQWLYDNGYDIYDESLVEEGNKIYNVLAARWVDKIRKVDEVYYHIGEHLILKRDPLLKKVLDKKLRILRKIIDEIAEKAVWNNAELPVYQKLRDDMKKLADAL